MKKTSTRGLGLALVLGLASPLLAQDAKLPPRPKDLDAALLAKAITPAVTDGNRLEVIDQATDQPVVGAEVFVIEESALQGLQQPLRDLQGTLGDDPDRYHQLLAHWYGVRYQTGAEGTVTTAKIERGTVVAFAGNRFAALPVRKWPEDGLVVKLVAQQFLAVRVVDSQGKPAAEVPVGFGNLFAQGPANRFFLAEHHGLTDGAGRLRVPRARVHGTDLTVQVLVPTLQPVSTRLMLDTTGHQTEVPTLQLPPCGMVRVLLYDESERPIEGLQWVQLQPRQPGKDYLPNQTQPSQLTRGSALFRWVPLDLQLQAKVQVEGMTGTLTHEQDGPTHPGELVVCGVRMTAANPILRLRVLDTAGKPMANTRLGIARTTATSFDGSEVTTDAEGRLQWSIDATWLEAATDGQVLLLARGRGTKQTLYQGALAVPIANVKSGITDLGDVALVEEPVALRGIVLGDDGKPLAGITVSTTLSHHEECQSSGTSSSGTALFFEHRVPTDAQGVFVLRELSPKDVPFRLTLTDTQWVLANDTSAAPRTTDLVLHAVRTGSAQLRLANPAWNDILQFQLVRDGSETTRSSPELRDGRFEWKGLVPGRYRLTVSTTDHDAEVLSDLEVPANGPCANPQLQNLDLAGHVQLLEVTVRGPGKAPLGGFPIHCVHLRGGGQGGNEHSATTSANGTVRMVLQLKGNTVWFAHADYRTTKVEAPTADFTIDLVARATARLLLPAGVKLPDGIRIVTQPTELPWWAETLLPTETIWSGGKDVTFRPDREGELDLKVLDRAGGVLWKGRIHVPAGDAVDVIVPLAAATATDIEKQFREGQR